MSDYKVSDYGIFNSAIQSTNNLNSELETDKATISECHAQLSDDSIFMGPISESCTKALNKIDKNVDKIIGNFNQISSYLDTTATAYQNGDKEGASKILNLGGNTSTTTGSGSVKSSVKIPKDIDQAGYTVTCYGEGGWYLGGGASATPIASDSNQAAVHDAWLKDGGRYKNGIAVMNVNGEDRYLVATSGTYGSAGDSVNVNLANGETVPCVLADIKSSGDSNYDKYGHMYGNQVNILEFEVDRNKFNSTGNPTTSTWGLDWDSSSNVSSIDNCGSAIKK